MPERQRLRWLDFLSYIQAMIYHEREAAEATRLQQVIEASVATDQHRQEVSHMSQTYAEFLEEKGMRQGELSSRRETLRRQLRARFGELSASVTKKIQSTTNVDQLDAWLDRVVIAKTLDDMGIL